MIRLVLALLISAGLSPRRRRKHPMGEAEAKKRLRDARRRQMNAPTRHARNLWRHLVVKRRRKLKEVLLRKKKRNKPHVAAPNMVRGKADTLRQKEKLVLYAMRIAHKEFRLYYRDGGSMPGDRWALTNVIGDWLRSDCSLWDGDVFITCGLGDVLFKGRTIRFTGTALEAGTVCTREYAEKHVGCGVIWGSGSAFHMGLSTGKGPWVYAHGRPPISKDHFDVFGPGVEVRYRKYL